MQINERDITIPLRVRLGDNGSDITNATGLLVRLGTVFVACLGLSIFFLIVPHLSSPSLSESWGQLTYPLAFLLLFTSLLLALTLPIFIHGLRAGPWQLCIGQEGIFYSYMLPLFIRWDEITALVPSTLYGYPTLSIVVGDSEAVFSRWIESIARHSWQRIYYTLLGRMGLWHLGYIKAPSPFYIMQQVLPISIGDLVMMIQVHFAPELRTYHIAIGDNRIE